MEPGGDRLKRGLLVAGLLLAVLLPIPGAQAVPEAPGGLRAVVTQDGGTQRVELRFLIAPDDPDQDVGTYQYNWTADSGTPLDLGDIRVNTCTSGDGIITCTVEHSGPAVDITYTIHAYDAPDEGPASCPVTINTGTKGNYHSCGEIEQPWATMHCLSKEGNDPEFNWHQNLEVTSERFGFNDPPFGGASAGGVNLAGDSDAVRWDFTIKSQVDGASSRTQFFFSEVASQVGKTASGNLVSSGSFSDGWGVTFKESGNDYTAVLFQRISGAKITHVSQTFSAGINANNYATGYFEVDSWAGVARVALGSEEMAASLTGTGTGNMWSFWATGELAGVASLQRSASNCLSTHAEQFGGSLGGAGHVGDAGQGLEDFEGQGGLGGAPMFPGMNVEQQSEALGMEIGAFATLMAMLLVVTLVGAGFWLAAVGGAGVGGIVGLALAATFNLMPLWLLVVLFLLSAGLVVVGFQRGRG